MKYDGQNCLYIKRRPSVIANPAFNEAWRRVFPTQSGCIWQPMPWRQWQNYIGYDVVICRTEEDYLEARFCCQHLESELLTFDQLYERADEVIHGN